MAIVKKKEVRSGKPVIKATRVTVEDISETFYKVGRSVREISDDFSITEEEVEEALRYTQSQQSDPIKA